MERYINEQETTVLPRFVSPRVFVFFWILLGLLSMLGLWVCFARIPAYTAGHAFIINKAGNTACAGTGPCIVAVFPVDTHRRVIAGETLLVKPREEPRQWSHIPIKKVEADPVTPDEFRNRFGSTTSCIPPAKQDVSLVFCSLAPDMEQHLMSSGASSPNTFRARVKTGTRRLASFLPLIGRVFQ